MIYLIKAWEGKAKSSGKAVSVSYPVTRRQGTRMYAERREVGNAGGYYGRGIIFWLQ